MPEVSDDDVSIGGAAVVERGVAGDWAVMLDDVVTEIVVDPVGVVRSWVLTPDVPVQPTSTAPTRSPMAAIARFRIPYPRVTEPIP